MSITTAGASLALSSAILPHPQARGRKELVDAKKDNKDGAGTGAGQQMACQQKFEEDSFANVLDLTLYAAGICGYNIGVGGIKRDKSQPSWAVFCQLLWS